MKSGDTMREKEDLRIRKTKANLYKGIIELLKTKKLEEINITDICKASMINRSTFYDHFNDKQGVLEALIQDSKEECIEDLKKVSKKEKTKSIKDYYVKIIEEFIQYIEKHPTMKETIQLIEKNDSSTIYNMLLEIFQECGKEELKNNYENTSSTPIEMISLFYASGIAKVLMETNLEKKTVLKEWDSLLPELPNLKQKKEQ